MKHSIALFTLLLFAACSQPVSNLINLDLAKKAVRDYYEKGEYQKECSLAFAKGIKEIESNSIPDNAVVIFDVDDTALSNYDQTKDLGFGYVFSIWDKWMKDARAKAIPETKNFYDWLIKKNIKVIFLTGRKNDAYEATKKNLMAQGYSKFDTLIVRNNEANEIPATEWKSFEREKLVQKGYKIIASVGDQDSDFEGDNIGIKIKLPNYLYIVE